MSDDHKIFKAETLMNISVGIYRYRAFCKCGWVSEPTESEATYQEFVRAHLEPNE